MFACDKSNQSPGSVFIFLFIFHFFFHWTTTLIMTLFLAKIGKGRKPLLDPLNLKRNGHHLQKSIPTITFMYVIPLGF